MSPSVERLLEDALRLSERERADLAASIIDTLDQQVDEDAESAWDAEIARRTAELDAAAVKAIPWPEARRTILGAPHGPPSP